MRRAIYDSNTRDAIMKNSFHSFEAMFAEAVIIEARHRASNRDIGTFGGGPGAEAPPQLPPPPFCMYNRRRGVMSAAVRSYAACSGPVPPPVSQRQNQAVDYNMA